MPKTAPVARLKENPIFPEESGLALRSPHMGNHGRYPLEPHGKQAELDAEVDVLLDELRADTEMERNALAAEMLREALEDEEV
jgi:hypothetical protein